LLQAAVIPLLLLAQSPEWIWVIYLVAFIESSLGQFFSPAENALLPKLVDEAHLVSANALNSLNDNLARLIGPAIGGALLGIFGLTSVILFDAISYLAAAGLILLVAAPTSLPTDEAEQASDRATSGWGQVWREWLAGLKFVAQEQVLRSAFIVVGIALFGDAILSAVMVVFVQDDMGLGAVEFGWLMTARGLGGLLGGLLVAQLGRKLSTQQMIAWGLLWTGIIIAVMVSLPRLYVALPLLVVAGVPLIAWLASIQTLFQQETEDDYLGRVFGAFGTTNTLLMLVGSVMAGALADQLGATILMFAAAVIYMLAGVVGWGLLVRLPEPALARS
jgi:predicted MFS family arabinose efflux permease